MEKTGSPNMGLRTYIKRGLKYIRYGFPNEMPSTQYITANIIVSSPDNRLKGKISSSQAEAEV